MPPTTCTLHRIEPVAKKPGSRLVAGFSCMVFFSHHRCLGADKRKAGRNRHQPGNLIQTSTCQKTSGVPKKAKQNGIILILIFPIIRNCRRRLLVVLVLLLTTMQICHLLLLAPQAPVGWKHTKKQQDKAQKQTRNQGGAIPCKCILYTGNKILAVYTDFLLYLPRLRH